MIKNIKKRRYTFASGCQNIPTQQACTKAGGTHGYSCVWKNGRCASLESFVPAYNKMTKDKTQSPPKIGFGEQTADRVCADVITNSSISNEFDKWVSLCQRAGIGMSQWLAAHVSNPSSTQALTLPVAENVIGIETLTNIQAKLIADVIFYWQMNSDAIQQQFAERYATHPDPNLITAWAQMLMENFYRPDNTPLASYPKVHALLKNKVFTCNSTNGSSIISTDSEVSFTKTNGTSLTLNAGDPCQFGSEFSEFTFQDNTPHTRPNVVRTTFFVRHSPIRKSTNATTRAIAINGQILTKIFIHILATQDMQTRMVLLELRTELVVALCERP